MRYKFKWILLLVLILPGSSLDCYAQASEYDFDRYAYQTEAFAILGTGSWFDNDSGTVLGGGIVLRPYPKAGFEISYRSLKTEESNSGFRWEQSGYSATASVHYYISTLRYQPYLLLGGGFVRSETQFQYLDEFGQENVNRDQQTSFVLEAGGGVNIFLTQKLSVRPDVRLIIGSAGSIQGALHFCYHW